MNGLRAPESPNRWPLLAILVLAMAAVATLGPLLLRGPTFIAEVKILNPSEYDIHVEVSGGQADGWLPVTTADSGATTMAVDVVDQGANWIFRFSAQGRHGGELRTTRSDLKQAGWSIEIPDDVIGRLRQEGAPPSP